MPEFKLQYTDKKKPGFNLGVVLNKMTISEQVGIEIEVEGNKFPKPPGMSGTHHPTPMSVIEGWTDTWSYVHDGSLRGQDNAEYVLSAPIMFKDVPAAINELYANLLKYGSKLDISNRTSVHVHLNCQEFHMNRLTTLLAAWFAVEEILVEFCGEHRVGNLFCLRAVDAPAIISQLRKFIRSDGQVCLSDMLHYAGLNPSALHKHGSVEIRTLRGCTDPQVVIEWLAILQRLYELSAKYENPCDLVSMFSSGGPLSFFDIILGDKADIVRQGTGWSQQQISDAMFRGIRFAQDLCYCRDWSAYKPMSLKADPFGRSASKVAAAMLYADTSPQGGEEPMEVLSMPDSSNSAWGYSDAAMVTMQEYVTQTINHFDPFDSEGF